MKLYLGCSQWGYTAWVGKIYPPRTEPKDFLSEYSRIFNSVELNPTFHQDIDKQTIRRWKNKVKPDFKFCPKFSRTISHDGLLKDVEDQTKVFLDNIKLFANNLGVCFIQLPRFYPSRYISVLENFIKCIPKEYKISVELRVDWLENQKLLDDALAMLKKNKTGIVIVDSVETRQFLNRLKMTNSTGFIRFIAYGHPTDYERIDDWIIQIKNWKSKGMNECYFFLHFPSEEGGETEIVEYAIEKFKEFDQ
jgi:uncharacterized protein YecE (DUF72 family)